MKKMLFAFATLAVLVVGYVGAVATAKPAAACESDHCNDGGKPPP